MIAAIQQQDAPNCNKLYATRKNSIDFEIAIILQDQKAEQSAK
jgi:hypothetical protein